MLHALATRLTAAMRRPVERARRTLTEKLRPAGVAVGGAERIRGELLELGIRVAQLTSQLHILAVRPPNEKVNSVH